jgi:XrtJ-associated TM-motif-TM protein
MNVRKTVLALGIALMAAIAVPLRAQTGCDDSPEDPTLVLALVGGAGALAAWAWRGRGCEAAKGKGPVIEAWFQTAGLGDRDAA